MTEVLRNKSRESINNRLIYIITILLPYGIVFKNMNNDIWFLLNSGRYVLESGIPHIEPFTIHQGYEFVMQQWLSSSIFWVIYHHFGGIGLNVLVFIFYLLSILIMYKLCMKVSKNNFYISYTVTLVAISMMALFMTQRPFLFSNFILLMEVYLLESYIVSNQRRYLFYLPMLSILLINLHAAMWPMLFVIMLPYIIDSFRFKLSMIQGQGYPKRLLFGAFFVMLISGFLNPYGIEAMTYLARSYGYREISNNVAEMRPPNINSFLGAIIYGSILSIGLVYVIHRKGSTKVRYVLLLLGTAYMSLSSFRSFSFFAICGVFPLAYYLKDVKHSSTIKSKGDRNNQNENKCIDQTNEKRIKIVTIVFCFFIVGFLIHNTVSEYQSSKDEYLPLIHTINYIKKEKNQTQVKLYTIYDDGGMAEFMGIPAYIDPRAEVFVKENNKKEDVMEELDLLQAGKLYYMDFLEKYNFTHLIIQKQDILHTYLPLCSDYQVSYSNDEYTLYERILKK